MATNDFLVFGGAGGANVITQAVYAALAARASGFSSGVAQSAACNKAWRQSSIMAAVLSQFISDRTGQDVLDDGTTGTILVNMKAAASAFNGAPSLSTSTTLTAAQAGAMIYFFGSTASQTLTLPAAASLSTGQRYKFSNFATVPVTVARTGSDTILVQNGVTSVVLQPGDDLEVTVANSTQWIATGSVVATGRYLGTRVLTATGTYTATPGTKSVVVELVGGGGGGGASNTTSAALVSAASGGGAGAYARSRLTSGFSGVTVTIGNGGSGGTGGAAGNVGGTTSFGALVSAVGGNGGTASLAATPPYAVASATGGAAGVSGNILNAKGGDGTHGNVAAIASFIAGGGGSSLLGAGPVAINTNTLPGANAISYGAGGSGAANGASTSGQSGGNGAAGVCLVHEYA